MSCLNVCCLFLFFLSDDWQGLDGMVIQKNPDENVNHLPSAAICEVDEIVDVNEQSCVNKRYPVYCIVCLCFSLCGYDLFYKIIILYTNL